MVWILRLTDNALQFHQQNQSPLRRSLIPADHERFADWARCYERAVKSNNDGGLLDIGREIYAWLDADGHGWGGKLTAGTGSIALNITTEDNPDAPARTFLDVPWELLATSKDGYLAAGEIRPFCVLRRLGEAVTPHAARHQNLSVMFMAAAPRNVTPVLDYEAEEAGILAATAQLPLLLTVDESGSAAVLKDRLAEDEPFEVVHLTCHGEIGKDGPVLALEDDGGDLALTTAAQLSDTFGEDKPGLLFLSACRSAEHGGPTAPLALQLLQSGVPAVLGWDGSVYDTDASHFARETYAELARHERPALAIAKARQRLLAAHRADTNKGRHWHLARLYVGAAGGGPLCARNAPARHSHRGLAYRAFLDKETSKVPVAGPAAFVGRRRALQDVFRAWRDPAVTGVLIHGFGGQGKSSLAARIADRLTHHKTALVFAAYDAHYVFEAALKAVIGEEAVKLADIWRPLIKDADALKAALIAILNGPCAAYQVDAESRVIHQPLLLIIDDLERLLEPPSADSGALSAVKATHRAVLTAVLEAFAANTGQSRLIFTSRYDFALPGGNGTDLAARLARVHLRPFDDLERKKQQSAAARGEASGRVLTDAETKAREELLARCSAISHGNALVLETLTRTALTEPDAAKAALAKLEDYYRGGATPDEGELADAFKRLTVRVYRDALSKDEVKAFRAMMLFEQPVPEPALLAASAFLVQEAAETALSRFYNLGLADRFDPYAKGGPAEGLVNMLARPQFEALSADELQTLAKVALPPLMAAWCGEAGNPPFDARSLEVFRLAQLAGDAAVQGKAALYGGRWLFASHHEARGALALVVAAQQALADAGLSPEPELLRLGIEAARRLGEASVLDELLAASKNLQGVDTRSEAMLWLHQTDRLMTIGDFAQAEQILRRAEAAFRDVKDDHHTAVTMGKIADIYQARGELDEALRIHEAERMPIAEKLRDVDSVIHILFNTSRIRIAKGIDSQESFDRILGDLTNAYALAKKLTRLDAICAVADDLGELLAKAGATDEARPLLIEARDGYLKLGATQSAARIVSWLAQLDDAGDTYTNEGDE